MWIKQVFLWGERWDQVAAHVYKSLKSDDVSKIHLDDEESISRSKNAWNEVFGMNALWSGEKGKLPSVYCIPFWILLKKSQDVWFKMKCAFNICNSFGSCSENCHMTKHMVFYVLSLEILYWVGVFAELDSICWCVEVSEQWTLFTLQMLIKGLWYIQG